MKTFILLFSIVYAMASPLYSDPVGAIFSLGSKEAAEQALSNDKIVQNFYHAFETNNLTDLMTTITENCKVSNISEMHHAALTQYEIGSPNLKVRMSALHRSLSNISIKIEQLVMGDNKVVAQVSLTGIQNGSFIGIAPTNRYITIRSVSFFRIENGKIVQIEEMIGEYNLMRQLGYFVF
ncbi:MAG: ester cyclase [Simkaniaceae bacterium]|nr:ester cyclase [Simkaniaceae bacterium]MCF7852985.1 ester cyclase [Simkaniaceae bacterium]